MKHYNAAGYKVTNIKADTHYELKEYCTKNNITMLSFIEAAIREKMEREATKNKK